MIDLKKTCVIVNSYPTCSVDQRLMRWFNAKGMPLQNVWATDSKDSLVECRNMVVRDLVLPNVERFEHFWFFDDDTVPTELTDPMLDDVPFDVVGGRYDLPNKNGPWLTPDQFHMGCVRMRAHVLPKIAAPWFLFEYNADATKITNCECGFLRNKIIEAGFSITLRGHADNASNRSWHRSAV